MPSHINATLRKNMPFPQVTLQASVMVGLTVKHHTNANAVRVKGGSWPFLVRSRTPTRTFPTGFPAESPQPSDISDMLVLKVYISYINTLTKSLTI